MEDSGRDDWGGESEQDAGGWDRYSDKDSGRDRYSSGGRNSRKPGDWDCPSCKFINYASRTACLKCRIPKDMDSFGSGGRVGGGGGGIRDMRPGDWICPECKYHNFSSRGICNKCPCPRGMLLYVGREVVLGQVTGNAVTASS
ncbi:tRNA-guanine transglycosylase [Penaeus vannamei]|uniref:tRNA-guanine transglycosylase n=1 Tax=Penaeus vannamei TaxID=6689 RepID=A0A3R7PJD3_PENVA|nr:tRNA-guanine transglycosylase [Penaeus vannamei]